MIIKNYEIPHSSFMSVDKDLQIITKWMMDNKNLCKMLFYTDRDALDRPNLTEAQREELFSDYEAACQY